MKRIFAIIMIVVMTTILGGCAKTTAEAQGVKFKKLMYFEKYRDIRAEESIIERPKEEGDFKDLGLTVLSIFEEDSRISNLFEEARADIWSFFGGADFFDWDRFETAKLWQIKEELMTAEGRTGGADAGYLVKENAVIVFSILRNYPDEAAKAVMAHELIHALTESINTANVGIYEGLTEILSAHLYKTTPSGYPISCNFVENYIVTLGAEKAIKNVLSGKMFEDIDSKTVPGAMEDALKSIIALDLGYATEADYVLCIDLLANYAVNNGTIDGLAGLILNIRWSDPEISDYFIWLIEEGGDKNTAA